MNPDSAWGQIGSAAIQLLSHETSLPLSNNTSGADGVCTKPRAFPIEGMGRAGRLQFTAKEDWNSKARSGVPPILGADRVVSEREERSDD